MTTPAVIQLQEYATDEKHDVSALLRKALLVATKLKLFDFKEWLSKELNGYKDENPIPQYRTVRGDVYVQDRLGVIPYIFPADSQQNTVDLIRTVYIGNSVSSLGMRISQLEKGQKLFFTLQPKIESCFAKKIQGDFGPVRPIRAVDAAQLLSIIDTVRTRILEWALALEEEEILGEGLTFSPKEKEIAEQSMTINNIENFQGVLGNVSDSTVTQTNHLVVNSGDFKSLAEHLRSQGVANQDIEELQQAVTNDPAPTQPNTLGANVSAWRRKMVAKAADGSWNVGVAASGGLLANALGKYYGL